ncbi:MAG: hypothetical protein JW735_02970 [Prolixibacteraceae bacterium]|nr:hypothetical protein [Prolixibacteraceae bacterium]
MNTNAKETKPIDEETSQILNLLYASVKTHMRLPNGKHYEVPETGNISLLASGYKGVIAWRKKREEVYGVKYYSPFLNKINQKKNPTKPEK